MSSSSSPPQTSNPNPTSQWLPSYPNQSGSSAGASLMLSAVLSLIFVVIVITIHLYTRYRRQYESNGVITIIHSRSPPAPSPPPAASPKGLDAAAIEKLPTFPYRRSEDGGRSQDCAVCLSAAEDGEMVRMLPQCKHLFHVGCIDMWLHSHSTCPVCRAEAKALVTKFVFGEMVAAPRLPERGGAAAGSGGEVGEGEDGSELQRSWVVVVDGERDLERQ